MYRTVLLAYDGSREGRLALREGALLAQTCNARVVLMAVVEPSVSYGTAIDPGVSYLPPERTEDFQNILDEGAARLNRMGLTPETRLETGLPVERITAVAVEVGADLVVVGHQKQGVMARWLLGSVTASLSDSLTCSLLVARMEISDDELFAKVTATSSET